MLKFIKSIFTSSEPEEKIEEIPLSDEEVTSIKKSIDTLLAEVKKETESQALAQKYEEIGLYYKTLHDLDSALQYLELSFSYKKSIGNGYKVLMLLYNAKRAEAAKSGTMNDIDHWMNKMDEMRNIAKQAVMNQK